MVLRFFLLGAFLFMSCTDVERDSPYDPESRYYIGGYSSSSKHGSSSSSAYIPIGSSSGEALPEYNYCVFISDKVCLDGPFVSCPSGWTLSNSCPYGSSSSVPSSSSNYVPPPPPSSSSAVRSSSSAMPSSSSSRPASSSSQSGIIYGTPVHYGGETYETVVIGSQTWMARNLNYDVSGSKCYNDSPSNCATYGRLYDWATAMALPDCGYGTSCSSQIGAKHRGICPSGWHIPSNDEWTTLENFVGSSAGKKLKATSGWNENGNGTDAFGFAALPGGSGNSNGSFGSVGHHGYWWSAAEGNANSAYYRDMYYNIEIVYYGNDRKNYLFSVRCLQD